MKSVLKTWQVSLGLFVTIIASPSLTWALASSGEDGEGSSPAGNLGLFAPMILVFLIFYFLLIRPQAKQQKKQRAMLKTLQRGDEVVTAAGIHGKITSVTEETVGVEIADNVRVRLDKKQIARVKSPAAPPAAK